MAEGEGHAEPRKNGAAAPVAATFPKRFYKDVTIAQGDDVFSIRLDGRPARTPARHALALPTEALARLVADEWAAVETEIDPRRMPLTRLANSIIDGVSRSSAEVFEETARFAGSDLLVYRAAEPDELVARQLAEWEPVLAWLEEQAGSTFLRVDGLMFAAQPPATLERVRAVLAAVVGVGESAPFRLGALNVMTALTGSLILALAVAGRRLTAEQAWTAAHVDEDFQTSQWGEDAEATQRRALRWRDMAVAATLFAAATPAG